MLNWTKPSLGLFAVGGYGRREMLPYSDVDIMILSEDQISPEQEQLISTLYFFTLGCR